jgi:hypothetical protein
MKTTIRVVLLLLLLALGYVDNLYTGKYAGRFMLNTAKAR